MKRELLSACIVSLFVGTLGCGRTPGSVEMRPLTSLKGGAPSSAEVPDLEVLSLLTCVGDGLVLAAYSTPEGVEVAGFEGRRQVWHKVWPIGASAGAIWADRGRIDVAFDDLAGRDLVMLERKEGSWREWRIESPTAGSIPTWTAFLVWPDGSLHLLCFWMTRGGLKGRAGLFSASVDRPGDRWTLLRKGVKAWPFPTSDGTFVYLAYVSDGMHWAIGHIDSSEAQDTVYPEKCSGVLGVAAGDDGKHWVLWQPAFIGPPALTGIGKGGRQSLVVPGLLDYGSARLVVDPKGEVGVVGLSKDGVVYVRSDPADPARLVAKTICGRDQLTADPASVVGIAGFSAVRCGRTLHLLYVAVYRDHAEYYHKVLAAPKDEAVQNGSTAAAFGRGSSPAAESGPNEGSSGPTMPSTSAMGWQVYSQWPFDATEARRRQQATAQALGVQVEKTINLGRGVTMKLELIPAGEFIMGSTMSAAQLAKNYGMEAKYFANEVPQHRVRITEPFWIGLYDVTQQQYEAVVRTNPSHFKGPNNPVEKVSWKDAEEFCRRLSETAGQDVRLPTEAEWEYACRAGTATAFYFGDDVGRLGDYGWYDRNSGYQTHPVGQKQPNAWGLYDMLGNVCEWCMDWYGEDYYAKSPEDDPQGPSAGQFRVQRGAAWLVWPDFCRSAMRSKDDPKLATDLGGFRVVVRVQ
jgi:formylglycine-generating enzyme required for sulfatase activity